MKKIMVFLVVGFVGQVSAGSLYDIKPLVKRCETEPYLLLDIVGWNGGGSDKVEQKKDVVECLATPEEALQFDANYLANIVEWLLAASGPFGGVTRGAYDQFFLTYKPNGAFAQWCFEDKNHNFCKNQKLRAALWEAIKAYVATEVVLDPEDNPVIKKDMRIRVFNRVRKKVCSNIKQALKDIEEIEENEAKVDRNALLKGSKFDKDTCIPINHLIDPYYGLNLSYREEQAEIMKNLTRDYRYFFAVRQSDPTAEDFFHRVKYLHAYRDYPGASLKDMAKHLGLKTKEFKRVEDKVRAAKKRLEELEAQYGIEAT